MVVGGAVSLAIGSANRWVQRGQGPDAAVVLSYIGAVTGAGSSGDGLAIGFAKRCLVFRMHPAVGAWTAKG